MKHKTTSRMNFDKIGKNMPICRACADESTTIGEFRAEWFALRAFVIALKNGHIGDLTMNTRFRKHWYSLATAALVAVLLMPGKCHAQASFQGLGDLPGGNFSSVAGACRPMLRRRWG